MSRRVQLALAAIVSDDGTRCAAECPRWSATPPDGWGAYHSGEWCAEFGALRSEFGTQYALRSRECIAAEVSAVEGES